VGHATAEDLELAAGDARLHAGNVGGTGLLARRQFLTVGFGSSDDALLFLDREPVEGDEVVDPTHGENVAAARSGTARRDDRDVSGEPDLRVRGAVDEARDVPAPLIR